MYLSRLFIISSIALVFSMPVYSSSTNPGKDGDHTYPLPPSDTVNTAETEINQSDIPYSQWVKIMGNLIQEAIDEKEGIPLQLRKAYMREIIIEGNSMKALEWFQKYAEQGDAVAQYMLAYAYLEGYGVEKNPVKAAEWFQKAANQGHAPAQNMLGFMYWNEYGVEKNPVKAAMWVQKAADQGWALAQANLGASYLSGKGVEKNPVKAVEWFQKAANQGHAPAQNLLGFSYWNGNGIEENPVTAVEWFQKAADQGWSDAQTNLGFAYWKGNGVKKNPVKAVEWFQKAAQKKNSTALEVLKKIFILDPKETKSSGVFKEQVEILYQAIADIAAHCEQKIVMNSGSHGMREGQYALPRLTELYAPICEFGTRVSSILEPLMKAQRGLMVSCIKADLPLILAYRPQKNPTSLLIEDETITFGERNVTAVLQYKNYLNLIHADFKKTRKHINKLIDSLYPSIASLHACQQGALQNDPGAIERFQQEKADYDEIMAINKVEIDILKAYQTRLPLLEEDMKQLLPATTGMRNQEFLDSEEFNFFK